MLAYPVLLPDGRLNAATTSDSMEGNEMKTLKLWHVVFWGTLVAVGLSLAIGQTPAIAVPAKPAAAKVEAAKDDHAECIAERKVLAMELQLVRQRLTQSQAELLYIRTGMEADKLSKELEGLRPKPKPADTGK